MRVVLRASDFVEYDGITSCARSIMELERTTKTQQINRMTRTLSPVEDSCDSGRGFSPPEAVFCQPPVVVPLTAFKVQLPAGDSKTIASFAYEPRTHLAKVSCTIYPNPP